MKVILASKNQHKLDTELDGVKILHTGGRLGIRPFARHGRQPLGV